jgi:EmrB/QacA subfamily drug resistance transporter
MGKLGDLYGRKPILLSSIFVFVGASALAGAAQDMMWLIVARGIQGIGAGMLQATAFTSVSDMFPQPARRARWTGLITGTWAVASAVGPVAGGVLTDTLGWRSVFYINLPIGILALYLIQKMLPADLSPRAPRAMIDWGGAATITVAVSALLLVVEWGGSAYPWGSSQILSLAALGIAAFAAFVWFERRVAAPILPFDLFRSTPILITSIVMLLLGIAMFALIYYTPLLLQVGLGLTASQAGALQTPQAVSTALGALISGQLFGRIQRMKLNIVVGSIMMLAGTLLLLPTSIDSDPLWLSGCLALTGIGMGFQMPMFSLLVQSLVPRSRLGVGTAMTHFLRLIGSTIGTAVVGAAVNLIFRARMSSVFTPQTDPRFVEAFNNPQALVDPDVQSALHTAAAQLGQSGSAQLDALTATAQQAVVSGVYFGYVMAFIIAIISAALAIVLRTPDFRAAAAPIKTTSEDAVHAL